MNTITVDSEIKGIRDTRFLATVYACMLLSILHLRDEYVGYLLIRSPSQNSCYLTWVRPPQILTFWTMYYKLVFGRQKYLIAALVLISSGIYHDQGTIIQTEWPWKTRPEKQHIWSWSWSWRKAWWLLMMFFQTTTVICHYQGMHKTLCGNMTLGSIFW